MKYDIDKNEYGFDTAISASDWKYSAAITGLIYYFKELEKKYEIKKITIDEITDSYLLYNKEDINEENYLNFIETFYLEDILIYKKLKNQLTSKTELTTELIKSINKDMNANKILEKVFSNLKFDGKNKEEILRVLDNNRYLIIKESYKNKLYTNYCQVDKKGNSKLFESAKNSPCRVRGYYFDPGRKSKATGYNFISSSVDYFDDEVFDFIPFAFTGSSFETIFLNDNLDIEILENMNYKLREYFFEEKEEEIEKIKNFKQEKAIKDKRNEETEGNQNSVSLKKLFLNILQKKVDYIKYGIEIIYKNRDKEYFETWYLRNESIKILKKIEDFSKLDIRIKITDKYYFNLLDEIFSSILNLSSLRNSILYLLKEREKFIKNNNKIIEKYNYVINQLIKVNQIIRNGGKKVNWKLKNSIENCASAVAKKIEENKLASYRQKLLSSVVAKNHKRILDILTQLSVYSQVHFNFAFDYIENQTENEDIIHYFILQLVPNNENKENKENEDIE
ncbi:type I CRISPR-associated protein Cas8a1/Csx8 [Fusobacterium nucleatum]|nr:type I CRISPR-associated protein Cas8a1/Csx8 [Fusobacterium nucleatum]BEP08222.1 type I CRISPR-associated protein Cas8a1/Csx8 [Fusobacterium nucleatum]